jgi:protein involved in polysaccharide export with SLBB domain
MPPDTARDNEKLAVAALTNSSLLTSNHQAATAAVGLDDNYRLGFGDSLFYRVQFADASLDRTNAQSFLVVAASGEIEIPSAGRSGVSGKTCKQLAGEIEAALAGTNIAPSKMVVDVARFPGSNSGWVYVAGQVRTAGPVDFPANEVLTVSKAILRAGGVNDYSEKSRVRVTRTMPSGEKKVFVIDVFHLLNGKGGPDMRLEPGDRIFVGSALLTQSER